MPETSASNIYRQGAVLAALDDRRGRRQPVLWPMARSKGTSNRGLARAVRRLRSERGLSQERLASRADVTTQVVGAIEREESDPYWSTVNAIAAALDVSLAELVTLADKLDR